MTWFWQRLGKRKSISIEWIQKQTQIDFFLAQGFPNDKNPPDNNHHKYWIFSITFQIKCTSNWKKIIEKTINRTKKNSIIFHKTKRKKNYIKNELFEIQYWWGWKLFLLVLIAGALNDRI